MNGPSKFATLGPSDRDRWDCCPGSSAKAITITNYQALLDARKLQVLMSNGNWWAIRRSGKCQTWKRANSLGQRRFRVPFSMGLYAHGAITETDFDMHGRCINTNLRIDPKA